MSSNDSWFQRVVGPIWSFKKQYTVTGTSPVKISPPDLLEGSLLRRFPLRIQPKMLAFPHVHIVGTGERNRYLVRPSRPGAPAGPVLQALWFFGSEGAVQVLARQGGVRQRHPMMFIIITSSGSLLLPLPRRTGALWGLAHRQRQSFLCWIVLSPCRRFTGALGKCASSLVFRLRVFLQLSFAFAHTAELGPGIFPDPSFVLSIRAPRLLSQQVTSKSAGKGSGRSCTQNRLNKFYGHASRAWSSSLPPPTPTTPGPSCALRSTCAHK